MAESWSDCHIGALDCAFLLHGDEVDLGLPEYEDEEAENVYADVNTQLARKSGKLRRPRFLLRLKGTSADDLIAKENQLRDELRKPQNTLVFTPRGATNPVTFTLLRGPATRASFDRRYEKGHIGYYDVQLVAEPWGYGDLETPFGAAPLVSPGVIELGAIVGQDDPRLTVTVTRGWTGAGAGMQFVCLALCPSGTTSSDLVFEAEDSDLDDEWYDYSGNPNCSGGHAARLDASDTTAWTGLSNVVPAAALTRGRYRIRVRARATGGDEGYLAMRKQHSSSRDPSTTVKLNNQVLAWVDLGEWVHYGSDALKLYGKAVSGGLYVDRVVCVPVDLGYVWYEDPSEDTHAVTFGWLYDHVFTTTGDTSTPRDATGRMEGHGLRAPQDAALFVFAEPNGSDPDPEVVLDAEYFSRWEMFR